MRSSDTLLSAEAERRPRARRACSFCCGHWCRVCCERGERRDPKARKYIIDHFMRVLHFLLIGAAGAVFLWFFTLPTYLPPDQQAQGAWGKPANPPAKHPDAKMIVHPPVKVTCEMCSTSWAEWDVCQVEESCKQTADKVCTPLTAKDMRGNYTGCMCPWQVLSALDAMTSVHIPDDKGICEITFCDQRKRMCDDGCCRGATGVEEACGRTMQWYEPKDPTQKAYNISVCIPTNLTEANKRALGVCYKGEAVGRDCETPNLAPCCMGGHDSLASCQESCDSYPETKFKKECAKWLCAVGVAYLLNLILAQPCFWRLLKYTLIRIDRRVALVVDYRGGNLRTTTNGGKAVFDKFEQMGFDLVLRRSEEDATEEQIEQCLKELIRVCGEHWFQRSLIVVFFAGHGKSEIRDDLLYTYPHKWYSLKGAVQLFQKMHTSAGLTQMGITGCHPVSRANVLFVLDSCQVQAAPPVEGSALCSTDMPLALSKPPQPLDGFFSSLDTKATIGFIWSAKSGERRPDYIHWSDEHSPFTTAFLQAMDQNDPIGKLFGKIAAEMVRYSDELKIDCRVDCNNIVSTTSPFGRIMMKKKRSGGVSTLNEVAATSLTPRTRAMFRLLVRAPLSIRGSNPEVTRHVGLRSSLLPPLRRV